MANTYFIVPYADVTDQMVSVAKESNRDHLKHSIQGVDRVVLKVDSESIPPDFSGYQQYSHSEILTEIAKDDWG